MALFRLCVCCLWSEELSHCRYSVAWLEPNRVEGPKRGDVLVVVIGVLCWHPGSTACWKDNRPVGGGAGERESDHPLFNTTWRGLYPGCGQLKFEPIMHICALFDPRFNSMLVFAEGNKQFHLVSIYPSEPPPNPHVWRPMWTHALQRMQRYRSYIEAAFQRNPLG